MELTVNGKKIFSISVTSFVIGWIAAAVFYEQISHWYLLSIPALWVMDFVEKKYFKKDKE